MPGCTGGTTGRSTPLAHARQVVQINFEPLHDLHGLPTVREGPSNFYNTCLTKYTFEPPKFKNYHFQTCSNSLKSSSLSRHTSRADHTIEVLHDF